MKYLAKYLKSLYFITGFWCIGDFALANVDTTYLLQSLNYAGIITQDISIILGIALSFSGLMQLKKYGESRTMMSMHMTIAKPLLKLFAGAALLILPTFTQTIFLAVWGTNNVMAYTGLTDSLSQLMEPVIVFVRLIGVGAIIRGVILLSRSTGEGAQPGTMGKCIMHLIGGVLCINIVGTVDLMESIFFG